MTLCSWIRSIQKEILLIYMVKLFQKFILDHHKDSLNISELRKFLKGRSSFAILGSGSSVNKHDFNSILSTQTLTIGFNFWVFNSFIPDLYVFEIKPNDVDRFILWTNLIRQRLEDFKETIFIIKDSELDNLLNENLVQQYFPDELKGSLYYSRDAPIFGKNLFSLFTVFLLRRVFYPKTVLKYRGTLSFCLELIPDGNEVFLYGIDFDDKPHFWNSPDYIPIGLNKFERDYNMGGHLHKTIDSRYGLPIDVYLRIRIYLKRLKVRHVSFQKINLGNL